MTINDRNTMKNWIKAIGIVSAFTLAILLSIALQAFLVVQYGPLTLMGFILLAGFVLAVIGVKDSLDG